MPKSKKPKEVAPSVDVAISLSGLQGELGLPQVDLSGGSRATIKPATGAKPAIKEIVDKQREAAKIREDAIIVVPPVFREPSRAEDYTYGDQMRKIQVEKLGRLVGPLNAFWHENKRSITTEELLALVEKEKMGFFAMQYAKDPPEKVQA